ncbi:MAG: zinc ribbon domain-containing protein [Planctomycetaceae bacterium]
MPNCSHCRHELTTSDQLCPHCGETVPTSPNAEEPIARFTNIAEAGYFHSELEGHLDCEVHLKTQDHFDAPSASWWTDYILTVSATDAERATAVLRQLVSDTDNSEFHDFGIESTADRAVLPDVTQPQDSRIHWTPIVLTLAAGTFVVWATNQVQFGLRGQADRDANGISLWDTMSTNEEPWVQRLPGGRRREISVSPDQDIAILREDTDGDGILDRVSHVHSGQ